MRAIWYFVARRDVAAAKREIRKCKDSPDCAWRYSEAFLLAYEGALTQAYRRYRVVFRHSCPEHLPVEVEEFIMGVLEEEPDKVQLHFCLGVINYFAKGDKARALQELERFLEAAPRKAFPDERRRVHLWVPTLKGELRAEARKTKKAKPND